MTSVEQANCLVAGLDDTAHAPRVAAVAARLGAEMDLDVVLVQVVGGSSGDLVGKARLKAEEEASERLQAIIDEQGLNGRVAPRVAFGEAVTTLAKTAEDLDAQMLIVGSRGHGLMRSWFS